QKTETISKHAKRTLKRVLCVSEGRGRMSQLRNPFTPSFGQIPPYLAGRSRIVSDMGRAFDRGPGDPNLSTILVGARGTGKTALLSYLAEMALGQGWVSASVTAEEGMLEDILERAVETGSQFVSS